jgi:26S proteasome regulatory subunit N6
MAAAESARVQEAQKLAKSDPRKAEAIYKDIISKAPSTTSDAATREYETALVSLGEIYRDEKKTQELVNLVKESRTVFSSFAKAKSAKLGMSSTPQQSCANASQPANMVT